MHFNRLKEECNFNKSFWIKFKHSQLSLSLNREMKDRETYLYKVKRSHQDLFLKVNI